MKHRYLIYILFIFSILSANAQEKSKRKINGKVVDQDGHAMPFATLYLERTRVGTTSNADGFFSLPISQDSADRLVVRFVGYSPAYFELAAGVEDLQLNPVLKVEQLMLREVTIKSKKGKYDDPAYGFMRKAIEKRKYYKKQMSSFSCRSYIKGLQRLVNAPKKFMGIDVTLPGLDSTGSGIVYLSESVSEYHKEGEKEREVMLASKVSGNNNGFSFNSASDFQLSLYDELIAPGQITPRGIVSPLADQSFTYYIFEWLGTLEENGLKVHKIAIQPRRSIDPSFRGIIYIQDGSWRVHAAEVYLDKRSNIEFVDSLMISQIYSPVSDSLWMISTMRYDFSFKVLAFKGNGYFLGSFDQYKLNPTFEKGFFNNEILKITEEAKEKDSSYWDTVRPMTLTEEERTDYIKKDSLSAIWESKSYKDSIDRIRNKPKLLNLLSGYTYSNSFKGRSYVWESVLSNIQFNTVEGWVANTSLSYNRRNPKTSKGYTIEGRARYGFSSEQAYGTLGFRNLIDPVNRTVLSVEGGRFVQQLDRNDPISPIINSSYTLIAEENFMQLYDKTFAKVGYGTELDNGLRLRGSLEWEERNTLKNNSDYVYRDNPQRRYNENLELLLGKHQALTLDLMLTVRFRQSYISLPNRKVNLGTDYPTVYLNYRRGIPGLFSSETDFDHLMAGVYDEFSLGMAGAIDYHVLGGTFLSAFRTDYPDRYVLSGNRTFLLRSQINSFNLLPYYAFNSTKSYAQAHVRYQLQGLLMNKLPYIRKLKLRERLGANVLFVDGMNEPYFEWSAGIENFLKIISVEYFVSTPFEGRSFQGIRVGVPF